MGMNAQKIISVAPIPGLTYIPEYIDQSREADLIRTIDNRPWITELRRRVQHYGYRYDYKGRNITRKSTLGPLPEWLFAHCDELCSHHIFPRLPEQVIINEYQAGQGIAAHIDCVPCFEETIASLSLGSSCIMEFTHSETLEKIPVLLKARSLVVLAGDARYHWKHSIPHRKTDHYCGLTFPRGRRLSLTFRNVILAK